MADCFCPVHQLHKSLRSKSKDLIYFVEEIVHPWTESSED